MPKLMMHERWGDRWVLVINTGGTIGMKKHDKGLKPEPNAFVKELREMNIFHDAEYAKEKGYDRYENTLVLSSYSKSDRRVVYTLLEYDPLLDSSNMTTKDWAKIGKDIEKNYEQYDGFVILHGTDTMAYTSSALSFMCDHLGKPVILTGSQVPIYDLWNDARDNLLGALLLAGLFDIPEVCLYFRNKLYRGNRVTKVDAGSFDGFASPNLPPLAKMDMDVTVYWDRLWRAETYTKFCVSTKLNCNVGLLRLFPGITTETVRLFLQHPIVGVVLETYGTGNAPDNRPELLAALKGATDRGVIIINTTQCLKGTVSKIYATGEMMVENLRGEMSADLERRGGGRRSGGGDEAAGDEAAGDDAAGDDAAEDDAAGDDAAGDDAAGDDPAGDDAAEALSRRDSCLGGGPVYPGLGQRVEECGIPPCKPRPGPARGLVLDGVYRRHPPDGDREQPFRLPNQRDWGTPGRKPGRLFKRSRWTDSTARTGELGRRKRSGPRAARGPRRP